MLQNQEKIHILGVQRLKHMRLDLNEHPVDARYISLKITPIPSLLNEINHTRCCQKSRLGEATIALKPSLEDPQHPFSRAHFLPHDQPSLHFVPQSPTHQTLKEEVIGCLISPFTHWTQLVLHIGLLILCSQPFLRKQPQADLCFGLRYGFQTTLAQAAAVFRGQKNS